MDVNELVESWRRAASEPLTVRDYPIRLTVRDAARVAALADVFPGRAEPALLRDLVHVALDAVETALERSGPGPIVSETDEGDPVFGPNGPAVRYAERLDAHLAALTAEAARDVAP